MFHIYWGLGKGKTSTLNGSALRAIGANFRVGFYRFLKGRESHENKVLEQLGIKVHLFHYSQKFVIEMNEKERTVTQKIVQKGLQHILDHQDNYDIIIIDEFTDLAANNVNMLSEDEMIDFIKKINIKNKEVLVSGHTDLPNLFKIADLITFYQPQKHYFSKGIQARKGIEY